MRERLRKSDFETFQPANRRGDQARTDLEQLLELAGTADWEEIARRVHRQCEWALRDYPAVDAQDASQNVLVAMLRRDFLVRLDPRKGGFWTFVNGIVRYACLRLISQARRGGSRLDWIGEPACPSRASDPVVAAGEREFRKALEEAAMLLSAAERQALPDVLSHAQGHRAHAGDRRSTPFVREHRCRRRLRDLLTGFGDE